MDIRKARKSLDESFESCSTQEPSPKGEARVRKSQPPAALHQRLDALALRQRSAEILEALSHLFSEFLQHFNRRKAAWSATKAPYEMMERYTLRLDRAYRHALLAQVHELSATPAAPLLAKNIGSLFVGFVESLSSELRTLHTRRRLLAVICVIEASATVANASDEISRIVSPIYPGLPQLAREKFFALVLEDNEDLLEYAKSCEATHWAAKELLSLDSVWDDALEDSTSDEESDQEILQKLSIDDLVSFINAGPKKKSKKRKRKLPASSDPEVEAFKQKLAAAQLAAARPKPVLSEEFLHSLRVQLRSLAKAK